MLPTSLLMSAFAFLPPPVVLPPELIPGTVAADMARFPPATESMTAWHQSVRYRDWQRDKRRMGPTATIAYADDIAAAEWAEKAWDLLTYAQCYRPHDGYGSERQARNYLERLRVHLGDDWFARGLMPPPAPPWFRSPTIPTASQ